MATSQDQLMARSLIALALLKCLAGFTAGLTGGQLFQLNEGGVPGVLPWAVSAWLAYSAFKCWRDGRLDALLIAPLWALAGSWLADRAIRVYWDAAGEFAPEAPVLAVYVVSLWRVGMLKRMWVSSSGELRKLPRWVCCSVLVFPVVYWSTPGSWLPLTALLVYGPVAMAAGVTLRTMRGNR